MAKNSEHRFSDANAMGDALFGASRRIRNRKSQPVQSPGDAVTYYNGGISYSELKQYERAIEDFDKAIQLNPDYTDADKPNHIVCVTTTRIRTN